MDGFENVEEVLTWAGKLRVGSLRVEYVREFTTFKPEVVWLVRKTLVIVGAEVRAV